MGASKEATGIATRILSLQREGETNVAFARRVNVSAQTVSNLKDKRRGPSVTTLMRVLKSTGVSPEWLLLGTGDQRRTTPEGSPKEVLVKVRSAIDAIEAEYQE